MALKGTRTGVVVALSSSETCDWWSKDPEIVNGYEYLGTSRTMAANRVSNFFDLKGKCNFISDSSTTYRYLLTDYPQDQVIPLIRHLLPV